METQSSKHEKNLKHYQLSESFHKTILSWDCFQLPNLTENLNQVPIQFESFKHYKDIFEPLLFEETRAQITQALEEQRSFGPQAAFKLRDFDATDINLQTIHEYRRFVPISFSIDTNSGDLSKEDLLLISNNRGVHAIMNGSKDQQYQSQDPRTGSCAYTLAVVHELSHNNTVVHVRTFLDTTSKIYELLLNQIDNNRNSSQLNLWFAWNLTNLVTEKREYISLNSIETSPMLADILQPTKGVLKPPHEKQLEYLSQAFANTLRKKLNASQWEFIEASCACDGFILCQGPPGTGKTTTILGLLNCLHLIQFHKYYNSLMKALGRLRHQPTVPQPTGDNDESPLGSILNEMSKMNLKFGRLKQKQLVNKPRILVCTHSNGAVDELCLRLKRKGMLSNDLKPYWPDIVRVGPSTSTNQYVREVSLDHLVNVYIKNYDADTNIIKKLSHEINKLNPEINHNNTNDIRLAALYEEVYRKTLDMERYRIIQQYKQSQMKNPEEDIRISILNEAHIVFTTLSGSGTNIFSKLRRGFDVIVMDEAAQAVELSSMIPFMRSSPVKCIMVGDPKQLPATVISENSKQYLFTQSLFERFQRNNVKVFLLNIQYRMNPEIRKFPSKYFYEDKLLDGENVKSENWNILSQSDLRFKPLLFYDVFSKETRSGSSYVNVQEAKWCVTIYQELKKAFPNLQLDGRVGIITPYKQQMNELKSQFEKLLGSNYSSLVEINTVDSFQGREKDVILFSCVRSSGGIKGVGFLDDIRRMNVGLTRARLGLFVVGNYVSLCVSPHWKTMLQDIVNRNLYMRMSLVDYTKGPLLEPLNVSPPTIRNEESVTPPPLNTPPPPPLPQYPPPPMITDISMVPPELLQLLVHPPPPFADPSLLLQQQSLPPLPMHNVGLPPQIYQEVSMLLPPEISQVFTPEVLATLPPDQIATLLGLISNLQQQQQFVPPPMFPSPPIINYGTPPPPINTQVPMNNVPVMENNQYEERRRSPNRNNGRYNNNNRSPDRKRYREEKRDYRSYKR